jgi:unsaturated pyranuronate lyase
MSAFSTLGDVDPQEIWPGLIARPLHGANATLAQIELAPGTDVPEHAHENEQIGILLAGSLHFRIGDEERELRPGDGWTIPAHVPHAVRAGDDGAALVEVFAPARDDWADRPRVGARQPRLT